VLDGLDDVFWGALTHAYGFADDVPGLIRDLRSPDPDVRAEARYELYGNIHHQGTRYEASAYAVPFLLELVADPATPDRSGLVLLLATLATGDVSAVGGFEVSRVRAEAAQVPEPTRREWLRLLRAWHEGFDENGPSGPMPLSTAESRLLDSVHALSAYEAVTAGVPTLVELLDDPDDEVVGHTIVSLAWFPEQAAIIQPHLVRIAAEERGPVGVISAALMALGLLLPVGPHDLDDLLATHLAAPEPEIRWAAAMASARLAGTEAEGQAVDELAIWAANCGTDLVTTVWGGSRSNLALRRLDRTAETRAAQVRADLVAEELAKSPTSNWHNHFVGVLRYAFPTMDKEHGRSFVELAPAQQAVIRWLVDNPHVFGPLGPEGVLRWYGLPDTHEALASYLPAPVN
jgi:hypothetical protein